MPFTPIPINKGAYRIQDETSLSNSEYATKLVNLLVDDNGDNYDRPCLSDFVEIEQDSVDGLAFFDGKLIAVTQDGSIYSVTESGTVTNITGDKVFGNKRPVFARSDEKLFIIKGEQPVLWEGGEETTKRITDAPRGTHIGFLDQFIIMNEIEDGLSNTSFRWSDNGDFEQWPVGNFASAESNPDPILSLIVNQREIYIIGTESLELWTNIGDPTIPFIRTFHQENGTIARMSPVVVDNGVFFLDQNRRFVRFAGRQLAPIGRAVDEEIKSYTTVSDCAGYTFEFNGKPLILWLFPSEKKAWCYDLKTDSWSEWNAFYNGDFQRVRLNNAIWVKEWNKAFAGDWNSGKIYQLTDTVKTDAGQTFKRLRRFSGIDQGAGVRKRSKRLRLRMQRGSALSHEGTADVTNPNFEVRWRNEDLVWKDSVKKEIGAIGQNNIYSEIFNTGIYRWRQYEISMTDAAPFRLKGVEEEIEVMLS